MDSLAGARFASQRMKYSISGGDFLLACISAVS
jgi:hypothetical protein